jgi:hypothetical protein
MEEVERNHGGFVYYLKSEVDAALSRPAADSEAVELSAIMEIVKKYVGKTGMFIGYIENDIAKLLATDKPRPSAAAVPETWLEAVDDALEDMELSGLHSSHGYQRLKAMHEAAALTPAPRRIEREDAPTVDDGMGVG